MARRLYLLEPFRDDDYHDEYDELFNRLNVSDRHSPEYHEKFRQALRTVYGPGGKYYDRDDEEVNQLLLRDDLHDYAFIKTLRSLADDRKEKAIQLEMDEEIAAIRTAYGLGGEHYDQNHEEMKELLSRELDSYDFMTQFEKLKKERAEQLRRREARRAQRREEEAFKNGVDAQIRKAMVEAKTSEKVSDELPEGNLEDLLHGMDKSAEDAQTKRESLDTSMIEKIVEEETVEAFDRALAQLSDCKLAEQRSLEAQEQIKKLFLHQLVEFLTLPILERLNEVEKKEEDAEEVVVTDAISDGTMDVDVSGALVAHEPDRRISNPPKTNIKSLVDYCLSNRHITTGEFGKAHLQTSKTLEHFCTHAFLALWETHVAMHLIPEGFTKFVTDPLKLYKNIPSSAEHRRSWLVCKYIRDNPQLPTIILPDHVLDSVRTLNAGTIEHNSLREIQNAPIDPDDSPGVLFRIVIVIDRGERGLSGGYYEFDPDAFRDKANVRGRINVECTQDTELNFAYANNVNMKRWYITIVTDEGFVAVPASILNRAFVRFLDHRGRIKWSDGEKRNLVTESERQVFVHVAGGRHVHMSTLDTVLVDNPLDMNIFMNEFEDTFSGVHCNSKLWVYDQAHYCFPTEYYRKQEVMSKKISEWSQQRKRKDPPSPKSRGMQRLAAQVCDFHR